jgi:hypothetical protein
MRSISTIFAVASLGPLLSSAQSSASDTMTDFLPPTLTPFLHMQALTNLPTNISTIFGQTARYPNLGGMACLWWAKQSVDQDTGNFTGALEGEILALGAALEIIPPSTESESVRKS